MQINVMDKASCFQYYNSSSYSVDNDSEAVLSYITSNYMMNMWHVELWVKKIVSAAKQSFKGFNSSYALYLRAFSPAGLPKD